MKISRILHAGYLFESDKTRIAFDPIFENPFSRNCYAYPTVQFEYAKIKALKLDAIFISHDHDDHCSLESLQYLNRETPVYLYCRHEEIFSLIRELGFLKVHSLQTDVAVQVGSFEVTPRLALEPEVDSIFHIRSGRINVLNVVDAWIDPSAMPELMKISWDMVLWPFQTMREIEVIAPSLAQPAELPQEWMEQLESLNPRYIVPSSCQFIQEEWSWYRKAYFPISYRRFQSEVEARLPNSKVLRLNPGASVILDKEQIKTSESLFWVKPVGDQDVDYEYDPKVIPTKTSDIAQKLPALSEKQTQRVLNFCSSDLVEKFNALNTDLTGQWRLLLYDHLGERIHFTYELQDGVMKRTDSSISPKWVTELPAVKLYQALENGESLSSMYLRMQGMPFEEIFEDPLIACLFSGEAGSYQRAQLKRIYSDISMATSAPGETRL